LQKAASILLLYYASGKNGKINLLTARIKIISMPLLWSWYIKCNNVISLGYFLPKHLRRCS